MTTSTTTTPPPPPGAAAGGGGAAGGGSGDDTADKMAAAEAASILASPGTGTGGFTVASYLNTALRSADGNTNTTIPNNTKEEEQLQTRMASLALHLQVQTQSCHDEIGRIGAELQAILPRCRDDVGRLRGGVDDMKVDAGVLLRGIGGAEGGGRVVGAGVGARVGGESGGVGVSGVGAAGQANNTTPTALQTLQTLHSLHQNLNRTHKILAAASSWDETLRSIPNLLASSPPNLVEAVEAWCRLERGERTLAGAVGSGGGGGGVADGVGGKGGGGMMTRGMPGTKSRRTSLHQIKSQILTLLKPQLLHALTRMDTRLGPLESCVGMYRKLGAGEGVGGGSVGGGDVGSGDVGSDGGVGSDAEGGVGVVVEEYVRVRGGICHGGWFDFVPPSPLTVAGGVGAAAAEGGDDNAVIGEADGGGGGGAAAADVTSSNREEYAKAFLTWLPKWYGSVLALLAEETRRAAAVFGPRLAPGIVVRVLRECFRPILPSFRTRLASLCPPGDVDAAAGTGSSTTTWSLDSVSSAYEATLDFLSQSYELLAATFESSSINMPSPPSGGAAAGAGAPSASSSALAADSPAAAYGLIASALAFVASPFSPYQIDFAKVERKCCGSASELVARKVQAAVGGRSVSSDRSSLQGAVDSLQTLGSSVFSLAEASVSRFELLNCGYNTNAAVATVDDVIAQHAGELAIAVSTLRTSMTSDENQLAGNFDEELVQCSLEILKVAGGMKRDLTSCEARTRGVFREMSKRLELYRERYALIQGTSNSESGAPPFAVPDSLSSTDVAFIVARAACGEEHEGQDQEIIATLARFLPGQKGGGPGHTTALFPKATEAITRLAHTCHVFVFDVCSAVPRRALRDLPSLPIWRKDASTQDALTYGILPQQYITTVGEHMLALVQAIEPFASDEEALELADTVMEGSKDVALPSWREFASAIGSTDACSEETVVGLMNVRSLKAYVTNADVGGGADSAEQLEEEEEEEGADLSATALFTNKWLDVIGLAVTGYLLERTLRVPHLSQRGCEHFFADYSYLVNVFEALGIAGHPHPILLHFAKLFSMPVEELTFSADERSAMGRAIGASERRIGLMRGVESA